MPAQTYILPEGIKGRHTSYSAIPEFGYLVLTREAFGHYDLTITNRERLVEIHEAMCLLERPEREAQHGPIVTAALAALLHNNLQLNLNTFAVTVQALFTGDTNVIISAIHEVLTRLGFMNVTLRATDIFSDISA